MLKLFGLNYHSQNIASDDRGDALKQGKIYKGNWFHWRCWFEVFKKPIRFEIISRPKFSIYLMFNWDENEVTFHAFFFYLTIGNLLKGDYRKPKREVGFSLYEEYFWIYLWAKVNETRSTDPWWQKITIPWKDLLFGEIDFKKIFIKSEVQSIYFPEASYPVKLTFYRCSWRRLLIPFKKETIMVQMDMETPVPIPGKGESDWDCGDDAISSLWCRAANTEEALSILLKDVIRTRRKYGSGMNMYLKNKDKK